MGLGTLVGLAVLSSTLDITGILAASTLAVVGFFVIPFKRRQAKDAFKQKMLDLRTRLLSALTAQFNSESETAITRMKDGVAPYTRYVRSETQRIQKGGAALAALRRQIAELRARAQSLLSRK